MSINVRLGFTGLCAFVPHSGGARARALLLGGDDCCEKHVPALLFEKRLFAGGSHLPDMTYFHDTVEWGLFLLNDHDLEIVSNSTSPFRMENPGAAPNVCPQGSDHKDLSWVAPIERIRPGAGRVDASCLAEDGANVPPAVASRVLLDQGTLRTGLLSNQNSQVIHWQFVSGEHAAGHQQALAEVVELAVDDLPEDRVEFAMKPFRGFGPVKTVSLAPAAGSREVAAMVKCIPLADILGLRPVQPVLFGERRSRDHHFEHFFRISAADPGIGRGAVPEAIAACPAPAYEAGAPILHSPLCSPCWFEASEAA